MAVQAYLSHASRKIAKVIRNFAESEGLPRDDWAVLATYDRPADRIRMTLASDRRIDPLHWHQGILEGIRAAFPENPSITSHLGLVIRNVDDLETIYGEATTNDDQIDLSDVFEQSR